MQVRWLPAALRNLDDEATYIAHDSPQAAQLVALRVLHTVALLVEQPGLGKPGRVHGTRELLVPKTCYGVPYRVRGSVVEVLRVFHTARRPDQRW